MDGLTEDLPRLRRQLHQCLVRLVVVVVGPAAPGVGACAPRRFLHLLEQGPQVEAVGVAPPRDLGQDQLVVVVPVGGNESENRCLDYTAGG